MFTTVSKTLSTVLLAVALLAMSAPAQAEEFDFSEAGGPTLEGLLGEAALIVQVTDEFVFPGEVEFFFGVFGFDPVAVESITISDPSGSLSDPMAFGTFGLVDFATADMASPFTFDSTGMGLGIDEGEFLSVIFTLTGTLEELLAEIEAGDLTIGLTAMIDGTSVDFINNPDALTPIPLPAAIWLLAPVLGLLGLRRK